MTAATTAVCDSPKASPLADVLERIRAAADSIEDADSYEDRRTANAQASIMTAVAELLPVTRLLETIQRQAAMIDAVSYSSAREASNEQAQGNILLSLEELAFLLRQDDWATAHGFRKPSQ